VIAPVEYLDVDDLVDLARKLLGDPELDEITSRLSAVVDCR
jgi:hypothetical protein